MERSWVQGQELRWLAWDDVDLKQGLIHIRPKDDWTTKTGNVRSIPISDRARGVLQTQPRHSRWVFTARASPKYPQGVIRSLNAGCWSHSNGL